MRPRRMSITIKERLSSRLARPLARHTSLEVMDMAKQGMKRIDPRDPKSTQQNHKQNLPRNEAPPVPEIQGKAKQSGKKIDE